MMTRSQAFILSASLLVAAGLAGGCQTGTGGHTVVDAGPTYTASGEARTQVFDYPRQRRLEASAATGFYTQPGLPWYADRNDQRASVQAGYQSAIFETAVTQTYDRQRTNGGRVYDNYNRNTYRTIVQEAVR